MNQRSGLFVLKLYQKIDGIRAVRIQINSGFYFGIVLGLLLVPLRWLFAWVLAAIIHEFGHLLAIAWSGHRVEVIVLKGAGAEICTDSLGSDEWFCAIAGPMAGLVLVMLGGYFPLIGICAFFQTSLNLLPFLPLDGGRILKGLLCFVTNEGDAEKYTEIFGVLIAAILLFLMWVYVGADFRFVVGGMCIIIILKILQIKIPCKRSNKWVQ